MEAVPNRPWAGRDGRRARARDAADIDRLLPPNYHEAALGWGLRERRPAGSAAWGCVPTAILRPSALGG